MNRLSSLFIASILLAGCSSTRTLLIAVDARLPEQLPTPPTGKLAPGFDATVRVNGRYVGLTTGGLTIIEAPRGSDIADVRRRLPNAHPAPIRPPDQRLDQLDEVIVLYDHGTAPPPVGDTVLGFPVVRQDKTLRFAVLKVGNPIAAETVKQLAAPPGVRFVEPGYRYRLTAPSPPNDPEYVADREWPLALIHASTAWAAVHDTTAPVAILDTGIAYDHPDLALNKWVNAGETPANNTDDDNNGCLDDVYGCDFVTRGGDARDLSGHGTWVAGIAGAVGNNGEGVVGVPWRVPLIAVRLFQSGGSAVGPDELAVGIEYAAKVGARVLNASWSGANAQSVALSDAITHAGDHEALLIASAGIAGNLLDGPQGMPEYPASYAHANIIAVAATDETDTLLASSGYGDVSVDLGAPGVAEVTTALAGYTNGKKVGTSFAVPHVSGAAALVWGDPRFSTLGALAVRKLVLDNVDPVPTKLGGKCVTGGRLSIAFLGEGGVQQQTPPQP